MASLPKIRRSRLSTHAVQPAERTTADVQRLEAYGLTWLNIESPMALDAQWLAANYDFHELDIEDVLSRRQQRSKIDSYDDYVFIVLHFPRFDKRTQRMQAAELDLFMTDELLITLPKEPLKPLSAMWTQLRTREEEQARHMSKGSGHLMYELVDRLFDYCFPILGKIGHKLEWIEDQIFEDRGNEVVRDISNTKQEIINFRKIIKPQRPTLRGLERHTQRYTPHDLELYFDDIVDKNERIWDELENFKEVVEALYDTNEAVMRQQQESLIRVLTLLSALLLPLTLVTGFYGMNVGGLAGAGHWWGALMVLGIMVVIGSGFLWFFHRKRWL
jgi:magnesium transporter